MLMIQTLHELIKINGWKTDEAIATLVTVCARLFQDEYNGRFSQFLDEISERYKAAGR